MSIIGYFSELDVPLINFQFHFSLPLCASHFSFHLLFSIPASCFHFFFHYLLPLHASTFAVTSCFYFLFPLLTLIVHFGFLIQHTSALFLLLSTCSSHFNFLLPASTSYLKFPLWRPTLTYCSNPTSPYRFRSHLTFILSTLNPVSESARRSASEVLGEELDCQWVQ